MEDKDILERIKQLSVEDWFNNGEDAPEEIIEELGFLEADNDDLAWLLELTITGPGLTDVWLSRGVLIGDVFRWYDGLDEGEEVTEDEIYEDNKMFIAERRATLLDEVVL
jgi:hypothetical protein